jgi:small conductance mechanosensitive channel
MWRDLGPAVVLGCVLVFGSSARAQVSSLTPVDASVLIAAPVDELRVRLAPLPQDELQELVVALLQEIRRSSESLAELIVARRQAHSGGATGEQLAAIDAQADALVTEKSDLVMRANLLLAAVEAKGGDVARERAYVRENERVRPDWSAESLETLSGAELEQANLRKRVDELVASVRSEPPVHERSEPWTVSLNELILELQPLSAAEMEERVQKWQEILQLEVRKRIRMDIARDKTTDPSERALLVERAAEQQVVVDSVVDRIEVMLMLLQRRGGDVKQYRDYITTATGQQLNLTDPGVLWAQINAWLRSPTGGVKYGLNIVKFIAVLVIFWMLSRALGRVAQTAVKRLPRASSLLQQFVVGGVTKLTLIVGLVIAATMLGFSMGPVLAVIGAAGLVIGLALQGTLSNFASGILILAYRPFDVGDVVNAGGVMGKVDAMNLVSTSILTFDNQVMLVPNNQVWNNVITNMTGRHTRRVDLTFGVGYADDIAKAQRILEEIVAGHAKVLPEPAPIIKLNALGDNSVNFVVRPWTKTDDYWDVYWDLTRQVKERFTAEDINIPFPQRDLHVSGPIEIKFTTDQQTPPALRVESGMITESKPRQDASAEASNPSEQGLLDAVEPGHAAETRTESSGDRSGRVGSNQDRGKGRPRR